MREILVYKEVRKSEGEEPDKYLCNKKKKITLLQ